MPKDCLPVFLKQEAPSLREFSAVRSTVRADTSMNQSSVCSHTGGSNWQGFLGTAGRGLVVRWEPGSLAVPPCARTRAVGLGGAVLHRAV